MRSNVLIRSYALQREEALRPDCVMPFVSWDAAEKGPIAIS
jgi:hypothetical protein